MDTNDWCIIPRSQRRKSSHRCHQDVKTKSVALKGLLPWNEFVAAAQNIPPLPQKCKKECAGIRKVLNDPNMIYGNGQKPPHRCHQNVTKKKIAYHTKMNGGSGTGGIFQSLPHIHFKAVVCYLFLCYTGDGVD